MGYARLTVLALLAAIFVAGCGGTASTTKSASTGHEAPATPATAGSPAAFAWLHPAPPPPGWSLARLPGSAVLAYPTSWARIQADPGTVSAALQAPRSDLIDQYLNVTPQQGEETLQNWATFRPAHNQEEGDSRIQVLASAQGLRFRNGSGSCVIDRYRTPEASYQEIACLVRGRQRSNVIVAAALAAGWAQAAPELERAVSAFLA
jgi:hypothetical protein